MKRVVCLGAGLLIVERANGEPSYGLVETAVHEASAFTATCVKLGVCNPNNSNKEHVALGPASADSAAAQIPQMNSASSAGDASEAAAYALSGSADATPRVDARLAQRRAEAQASGGDRGEEQVAQNNLHFVFRDAAIVTRHRCRLPLSRFLPPSPARLPL